MFLIFTINSKQLIFTSEIKGATNFNDTIIEYPPGFITKFEPNEFGALNVDKYDFNWIYQVEQKLLYQCCIAITFQNAIQQAGKESPFPL